MKQKIYNIGKLLARITKIEKTSHSIRKDPTALEKIKGHNINELILIG